MQKGEWLPFSLLFSFCILHSAFPLMWGWGEGEGRVAAGSAFAGASWSKPCPMGQVALSPSQLQALGLAGGR